MDISDLKAGAGNVNITATVVKKDEPREVTTKYGKKLRVTNAIIKDDSGEITLSLWGDDIDNVNVGDKIEVSNGYVSEFKGNAQLSSGKFGKITIVSKGDGSEASTSDDSGLDDLDSDSMDDSSDDLNDENL